MIDLQNLTGLEKPLTKLVETVSEGFGVVGNELFKFDAKKIKRVGEAEAEIEKTKIVKNAEGQAEAVEILNRASKRFMIEQYSRQINLENIVVESKRYLPKKVSNKPVDKDWSARFLSVAQEISKGEVQKLLAMILAKEVTNPDTYSLRTLEVVRNLSKAELEEFKKFIALSSKSGFFRYNNAERETLEKYDLYFGEFAHLAEIGLFNPSSSLSLSVDLKANIQNDLFVAGVDMLLTSEADRTIDLGLLKFTDVGMQIFDLLKDESLNPKRDNYVNDFEGYLKNQGLKVSRR